MWFPAQFKFVIKSKELEVNDIIHYMYDKTYFLKSKKKLIKKYFITLIICIISNFCDNQCQDYHCHTKTNRFFNAVLNFFLAYCCCCFCSVTKHENFVKKQLRRILFLHKSFVFNLICVRGKYLIWETTLCTSSHNSNKLI